MDAMVASRIPERLVWAVNTLQVAPDDQLLEIGCGVGLAVSLVCECLNTGVITAIDQSEAMIRLARQRNQAQVAAATVLRAYHYQPVWSIPWLSIPLQAFSGAPVVDATAQIDKQSDLAQLAEVLIAAYGYADEEASA